MYCPKCGQQQVSDSMRYCSRCGLAIGGLLEWISSGGVLAHSIEAPRLSRVRRRRRIRRGAQVLFASAVITPIFLGLSFLFDSPIPLFAPFTVFLLGIFLMLYSVLFAEESETDRQKAVMEAAAQHALPEAKLWAPGVTSQKVRTTELANPPSVTENTTTLLNND